MLLIVDFQPFPCIYYFINLIKYKHIKIEQYESFQKMSFRNRYVISGANGLQQLTIPLKGGREQKTLIRNIKIDNTTNWKAKHWRSLLSAYSKAPFFEYYSQNLKELIFSEEELLTSFNIKTLVWACKELKINVVIEFTEEFIHKYREETDHRSLLMPKNFQSPEIKVPSYSQVFEDRIGFQPNLSIIDLLMCEGPNSINLLNSQVME